MIPFRVEFRPGLSLFEQLVYAAKKAMISGHLRAGDTFPSVRALSNELKINPNTAHKVVTHLIAIGLLEPLPGIGTVVVALPESSKVERTQLLGREMEQLVVEAKKLGIELEDLQDSLSKHWRRLSSTRSAPAEPGGRSQK
jgi:GntR family transcriptional regulator